MESVSKAKTVYHDADGNKLTPEQYEELQAEARQKAIDEAETAEARRLADKQAKQTKAETGTEPTGSMSETKAKQASN